MNSDRPRLRVLSLIDIATRHGGAERFAIGLAIHLPRDRFEPWICSTRGTDAGTARELDELGIRHVTLGRRARWDVHHMVGLATLLRRERFDILHAHKFGSNVWGTLIGRACGVPVVIAHEHTWSYEGNPLRAWLDGRVVGRLATRFVAVSQADAERMVSIEAVPREKILVIPAAAWWPRPASTSGDLRAELGLGADTPLVAVAAVLRPQKALSVMLESHALVLARLPDAHLVIAGAGECRAALEQLASQLGLDGHVHFLGHRDDVDSILQAADVAALSSDYEGTPVVIAEGMAARTPLVATAVGGVPDIVEDGRSGLLVPPRDPLALANALTRLLTDPAERTRIAERAATRLNSFTIEAIAARFADLYENLAREAGQ
jgi:glycosyltransferase involved in cell wall biosynthesis